MSRSREASQGVRNFLEKGAQWIGGFLLGPPKRRPARRNEPQDPCPAPSRTRPRHPFPAIPP